MMQCRTALPDELLPWLDATYMLLDNETKYPPLLGTGGNEGSGSYMSGFAQQVVSVIIHRDWDHALRPALFGFPESQVASSQTPGHFSPEAAGGPNAASAGEGNVLTNPWDYLLLLEGTLLFAAACVKRLEKRDAGVLSYPFCTRQSGVGYGSAAAGDEGNSGPKCGCLCGHNLVASTNFRHCSARGEHKLDRGRREMELTSPVLWRR